MGRRREEGARSQFINLFPSLQNKKNNFSISRSFSLSLLHFWLLLPRENGEREKKKPERTEKEGEIGSCPSPTGTYTNVRECVFPFAGMVVGSGAVGKIGKRQPRHPPQKGLFPLFWLRTICLRHLQVPPTPPFFHLSPPTHILPSSFPALAALRLLPSPELAKIGTLLAHAHCFLKGCSSFG